MEPAANNLPVIQEDLDLALLTARDLMSTPIRSIDPATTIAEAQQILLRYGHSGLPIVSRSNVLVGIISRRDVEIAAHHGFAFAPVAGFTFRRTLFSSPQANINTPKPMVAKDLYIVFSICFVV